MKRVGPVALGLLVLSQSAPAVADVWCQPIFAKTAGVDDYAVVPTNLVRVVKSDLQDEAQASLVNRAVLVQSASEAERLLKSGELLPDAPYYFLVRASAYDVDATYTVASNLTVYYSPARGEVDVIDSALGDGGPAKNLALLVGLPGPASMSRQACQVVL